MTDLDLARHYYAEELRAVANIQSEALVRAFAKVPREYFLGPGPWHVFTPYSESDWTTKDADPKHLYHNLLVAIDSERRLNNGYPSFLAFLIEQLELKEGDHVAHVGCGPGYYTLALAECVGPRGRVYAVDSNEKAIRALKKKADKRAHRNIEAHASSASDLGFIEEEQIDFVVADGLLCSIAPRERHSALREISRILRPNGRAYLTVSRGPWSYVDRADWETMLRSFRVERRGDGSSPGSVSRSLAVRAAS